MIELEVWNGEWEKKYWSKWDKNDSPLEGIDEKPAPVEIAVEITIQKSTVKYPVRQWVFHFHPICERIFAGARTAERSSAEHVRQFVDPYNAPRQSISHCTRNRMCTNNGAAGTDNQCV